MGGLVLGMVGMLVALVVLYMAQPRFKRQRMSSAMFFEKMPAPRERRMRFRWNWPQPTRAFWLQLAALILGLLALWWHDRARKSAVSVTGESVRVVVDTSASMDTLQGQGGEPRWKDVAAVIEAVASEGESEARRFRLSLVDLEEREVVLPTPTLRSVLAAEERWAPRTLGTDLNVLRGMLTRLAEPDAEEEDPVTHVLVVTDRPAPAWLAEVTAPVVVWRDIGKPVENIGFRRVRGMRDPLTGRVDGLRVEVDVFGGPAKPLPVSFSVIQGGATTAVHRVTEWVALEGRHTGTAKLPPPPPGLTRLELGRGGAYPHDDSVTLRVEDTDSLRVDWRVPGVSFPVKRWTQTGEGADFRVTDAGGSMVGDVPVIRVIGGKGEAAEILDFEEGHPVLAGVNLDAVEVAPVPRMKLPEGFRPVMRAKGGEVWAAVRPGSADRAPEVLVPGVPGSGAGALEQALRVTLFFNAVRHVLSERPPRALYSLTTPTRPDVVDNRVALHPGEGDTAGVPGSRGQMQGAAAMLASARRPWWPWLLVLALALLSAERLLGTWRGAKWR